MPRRRRAGMGPAAQRHLNKEAGCSRSRFGTGDRRHFSGVFVPGLGLKMETGDTCCLMYGNSIFVAQAVFVGSAEGQGGAAGEDDLAAGSLFDGVAGDDVGTVDADKLSLGEF